MRIFIKIALALILSPILLLSLIFFMIKYSDIPLKLLITDSVKSFNDAVDIVLNLFSDLL